MQRPSDPRLVARRPPGFQLFNLFRLGRGDRYYRIEDAAFAYWDRDTGRTTTVLGYPTNLLAKQASPEISNMFG